MLMNKIEFPEKIVLFLVKPETYWVKVQNLGSENINAVQKLMMQDRHVTFYEIKVSLGISSTNIYKIFIL